MSEPEGQQARRPGRPRKYPPDVARDGAPGVLVRLPPDLYRAVVRRGEALRERSKAEGAKQAGGASAVLRRLLETEVRSWWADQGPEGQAEWLKVGPEVTPADCWGSSADIQGPRRTVGRHPGPPG